MTDTYVVDDRGRPKINKDPDAVLDYKFNWATYLTAITDTIVAAEAEADKGVEIDSVSFTTTSVTVWASGGDVGETAVLTCRITTLGGRTDDRSVYLKIVER
jgi:hypothetical protein